MKPILICRLGKTEIKLHPVMLPYLLYAYCCGYFRFALIAIISICLHEAAHALTAKIAGKSPSTLSLLPIGAVMYLEDDEALSWRKRILVFMAGPVITLCICCCSIWAAVYRALPIPICRDIFLSNCSILLLNLIPAYPLDGGRLTAIILSQCLPQSVATRLMRMIGFVFGFGLIILNIFISWHKGGWNLSLAMAGCCIIYSSNMSTAKQRLHQMKEYINRKIRLERKGMIKTNLYMVRSTMPLVQLLRHLPANAAAVYLGCELGTMKIIGWVSEYDAVQHYLEHPSYTLLDILHAADGTISDKYDTN